MGYAHIVGCLYDHRIVVGHNWGRAVACSFLGGLKLPSLYDAEVWKEVFQIDLEFIRDPSCYKLISVTVEYG